MELKFNKESVKNLVEQYYKKYEDFDGKFNSSCSVSSVGYGMMETDVCVLSMKMVGTMKLLDQEISMTRELSDEDIKNVFSTLLEEQGYTVKEVSLDSGIKGSYEGFGIYETFVNKPYFNGVVVDVCQKVLNK